MTTKKNNREEWFEGFEHKTALTAKNLMHIVAEACVKARPKEEDAERIITEIAEVIDSIMRARTSRQMYLAMEELMGYTSSPSLVKLAMMLQVSEYLKEITDIKQIDGTVDAINALPVGNPERKEAEDG